MLKVAHSFESPVVKMISELTRRKPSTFFFFLSFFLSLLDLKLVPGLNESTPSRVWLETDYYYCPNDSSLIFTNMRTVSYVPYYNPSIFKEDYTFSIVYHSHKDRVEKFEQDICALYFWYSSWRRETPCVCAYTRVYTYYINLVYII